MNKAQIDINKIGHPCLFAQETIEEILNRHNKPKEFSIDFLPTLNDRIWGLERKKLVTVGARPSQGKSNLLGELAYSFSGQGKRGILFSFEMTKEECFKRWLANHCSIDNFDLTTGRLAEYYNSRTQEISAFLEDLKTRELVVVEGMGKTFAELFEIIEKVGNIDFVVLDYIQMVRNTAKADEKRVIDDYILKLRELAIKANFLAVIGSQINRGTFDGSKVKEPMMHELKQSGCLEEISDMVILLHWQYFYTREEGKENEYWIHIAKNRGGRTGIFECNIDARYNRICEGMGQKEASTHGTVKSFAEQSCIDK